MAGMDAESRVNVSIGISTNISNKTVLRAAAQMHGVMCKICDITMYQYHAPILSKFTLNTKMGLVSSSHRTVCTWDIDFCLADTFMSGSKKAQTSSLSQSLAWSRAVVLF